MTSTVLRVKRRLEENPQDALVLMCKRQKTDENEEISPSLFIFRGTVDNPGNIYAKTLVPRSNNKQNTIPKVESIIEKLRKERKEATAESRYEIVNANRGLNEFVQKDDVYNFVDIEPKAIVIDQEAEYEYDLYTSAKQDFDVSMLDNLVSIENYETNLIFGSCRDNGMATPSEDESEDSNDENNWRNDYPDSDHSSINEEDMIKAVARVEIDDNLSSDDDEDIYNSPTDLFHEDAEKFGAAYAKYKAKVLTENPDFKDNNALVHCSKVKEIDEESIEGYKEDSDDGFYYGQDEDTERHRDQYKHDSSDEFTPD